jgi:sugar phosphate isomerase/epimerase
MKTTRRDFLIKSGLALGSASLISPLSFGYGLKNKNEAESYGFQVWTIRKKLIEDFPGTLKAMAGLGYKEVEMCSPLGYSMAGFKPLNDMSGSEMRKIIEDSGLKCTSSHFTMGELRDSLDNRIEWTLQMGFKQIILSSFGLPKDASVDDFLKAADELNKIGEKTKAAGIQVGFHNHHGEFETRGDVLIYDALLDELDPDLVKMQFQVAVVNIGYNASDYFRKYSGRFISAHLTDWSEKKEKSVPVGQGIIDWKEFFEAAQASGVKNVFVEQSPEMFEESAKYLSNL